MGRPNASKYVIAVDIVIVFHVNFRKASTESPLTETVVALLPTKIEHRDPIYIAMVLRFFRYNLICQEFSSCGSRTRFL